MTSAILAVALLIAPPQKIDVPVLAPPTKDAAQPTPDEMAILREGFKLYQQKKFDDAIAKYNEVLLNNPNSATAMYEIAAALLGKGDFAAAIAMDVKSTEFRESELDKSYAFIGTAFDMMKEPKKAVEAYDRGIALLPHAGTLYYNKAITQMQSLHDMDAGLATLKLGAVADPNHGTTQATLAQMFMNQGLKTPALLALSRLLIIEPGTQRTGQIFQAWYGLLNNGVKVGADGKGTIEMNPNQSTAEGNLTQLDLQIPLSQVQASGLPEGTTTPARLAWQVNALIGVWMKAGAGKDDKKFLWTYYMPYFQELRDRKFAEPFVYYISQNVGMPGAREWIAANKDAIDAFLAWNKAYVWK
jgi:tetratricopeptide (TPR) repeat protein